MARAKTITADSCNEFLNNETAKRVEVYCAHTYSSRDAAAMEMEMAIESLGGLFPKAQIPET